MVVFITDFGVVVKNVFSGSKILVVEEFNLFWQIIQQILDIV